MKQGFAIWLVIGSLFALWLYNTGRVAAFKQFIVNTPARGTLPGATPKTASGAGGFSAAKTAVCAEAASSGIVTADCLSNFGNALTDPIGSISSGVSQLTFGLIKL